MTGKEYADLIAQYLVRNFGSRGLRVYREVDVGRTVIGKNRRIDIFVICESNDTALCLECKFQETQGTVDEKIPYALEDIRNISLPAAVVYAGDGFSPGVLHLLQASAHAVYCLPEWPELKRTRHTRDLDHLLALSFGWWDIFVQKKKPVQPET